jgi:hypothetical protein
MMLAATMLAATAVLTFTTPHAGESIAVVNVRCDRCAWDVPGREAVMLRVTLDGRYVQHLPVARTGQASYRLLLGAVAAGTHTLDVVEDTALTARELRNGAAVIETLTVESVGEGAEAYRALSLAPFVYARPDTVGRFTDVPLFMWYEVEPTARGQRYRYSVIFTNEDGGTPADRLMATWGRTTDIEYLYSVELDATGRIVDEDIQGPKHEILKFTGRREGGHPLLWVSTDNNMVLPSGTTAVRYAPAPVPFPLAGVSREAVMDAHPWLYEVMARELVREGKIVADAPPGKGAIPDLRRYVHIEACATVGTSALAFAIEVDGQWLASDRGVPDYRIVRDGCFRAAIPVPAGVREDRIRGLRAQAFSRPAGGGKPAPAPTPVTLTRINRVFMLDDRFHPHDSFMTWTGERTLPPDGGPVQLIDR